MAGTLRDRFDRHTNFRFILLSFRECFVVVQKEMSYVMHHVERKKKCTKLQCSIV